MSLTERPHAGGFILSTATRYRSIDNITIASGQRLDAGAVLGKITATGQYAAYDNAATDGTATAVAVLISPVDASNGPAQAAAIVRDAEVNQHELVWDTGQGTSDIDAGLADLKNVGIIPR
jgi:hypothetical protein